MILNPRHFAVIGLILFTAPSIAQSVQRGADLDSPELDYSWFGCSVSMPDNNTIAVGGKRLGENGGVVIQVWNGANWQMKGEPILAPAEWILQGSHHGTVVSMPDADTFASSTLAFNGPSVAIETTVVMKWNGNSWTQKGSVLNGFSVDMADTNHLALFQEDEDSGTAHPVTMQWDGSNWQEYGTFPANFNWNLGRGQLSMPDPQTLAIGMPESGSNQGSVMVFKLDGNSWVQVGESLEGEDNQHFYGWSISMPNANTLAVGARGASKTYVYTFDGFAWNQKGNTIVGNNQHQYGYSVSMPDSDHIAIGGPDSEGDNGLWQECGGVRVYQWEAEPEFPWSDSGWTTQNHPTIHGEGPNNIWGYSVSMPSPQVVAGGAPGNYGPDGEYIELCGHARVYDLNFPPITSSGTVTINSSSTITLHPNPTKHLVCISGTHEGEATWFNSRGQMITNGFVQDCYELSQHGPGIYFLKINTPNGVETHRVLVLP